MSYKDLFSCEKKIAIVTGAGGLIGREIAMGLHDFGAIVYAADINAPEVEEEADQTGLRFVTVDISSEESVKGMVRTVVSDSGRLDILVNCAYPRTDDWGSIFEEVPFASWKENLNSHLGGYFVCCREAAEQMKRQGTGGSIINLASIYGVVAPDFSIYEGSEMTNAVAYSAIKGGIIALTRYIATYYGGCNIRANTISPGGILDNQPSSFLDKYAKKTPLGRMANPQEVVGATVFLASEASSYVTGHNLIVDGGWTIW